MSIVTSFQGARNGKEEEGTNFTVEKRNKHNFDQVIKINIKIINHVDSRHP